MAGYNDSQEDTSIKFIKNMKELVAYAYKHTAHFPRRYSNNYTNRILMNINLAFENIKAANNIRIDFKYWKYGKTDATYDMYLNAFQKRTELFDASISHLKIVGDLLETGKLMEIQELVEDNDAVLKEFLRQILLEIKLITGIKKSDQRAFKRFSIAFGKDFSAY